MCCCSNFPNGDYITNTYDSVARLLSTSLKSNTAAYVYDLNGNIRTNGTRVFDYDDENEMIRVTSTNAWKKEYVYDGKMRLRMRKEFSWNGSGWTETNEIHYIWDNNVIVQTRDQNNLPVLTFTRGNDLSGSLQGAGGIGGLLAMSENSRMLVGDSSAHSYYHADGNGNVTMLINNYQNPVTKYAYDPFGNPLNESGSKAFLNPMWFSSQVYDSDTGFLHYKYRIYIPELDRWPNRDPLEEWGGLNLYEFCVNNPLYYFDPLGMSWWNPFSWFGPDRDKEGPVEAAQKAGECAKQACEDRMNEPIGKRGPLPRSGVAGAAGAIGGAVVEVGTGVLQAGPGITAIVAIDGPNSPCTKYQNCMSDHACDADGGKACDKFEKACQELKNRMSKPINNL